MATILYLICSALSFWPPSQGVVFEYGTSIVAFRTPDEVAVAADSRSSVSDKPRQPKSECKIRRSGNIYFAIAGNKREYLTNFDSVQIVDDILRADKSLPEKITTIEQRLTAEWEKLLPLVQSKDSDWYKKHMADRLLWGVIVFGADANGTYMYVRAIKEERPWSGKVFVEHRTDCVGGCKKLAPIGDDTAVDGYLKQNPLWYRRPLAEVVRAIVQAEIDLDLPGIAGPIDVLRITKDGTADWIQKKPQCEDSKDNQRRGPSNRGIS